VHLRVRPWQTVQQYLQLDEPIDVKSETKVTKNSHAATQGVFLNEMVHTLLQAPRTNG
jgi:hypothetical protein